MYYFYKKSAIPPAPVLGDDVIITKQTPNAVVPGVKSMQMGRKRYWYFMIMTFLYRGFKRVFIEYDIIIENRIVSKAVLISKVPIYKFLPSKGIHLCYCETLPEFRGKGYYPLLLNYIQNDFKERELYMIVEHDNYASIKGIEKAGFIKYAEGEKLRNGTFVTF